jgi:hypothetical protein
MNQKSARSISLKNVNPRMPIQAALTITTEPKSAAGQMLSKRENARVTERWGRTTPAGAFLLLDKPT